jgi:hypothetical protein
MNAQTQPRVTPTATAAAMRDPRDSGCPLAPPPRIRGASRRPAISSAMPPPPRSDEKGSSSLLFSGQFGGFLARFLLGWNAEWFSRDVTTGFPLCLSGTSCTAYSTLRACIPRLIFLLVYII